VSDGQHRQDGSRRTQALVVGVVVGLIIALAGGYLLARGGNDAASTSSSTASPRPTHTRSPTPSPTSSPTTTPTSSPAGDTLPDGRSFVYAKKVEQSEGASSLTFDLAEFLTDEDANAAAAAHGDEVPVPNGYYIVNDNPKLRTLPISPEVTIRYFPSSGPACCKHEPGTLDGFAAAVNGTAMTDYPDMTFSPWWITLKDGVIVTISQQYLP
jgi:hypothetical protein